MTQLDPTLAHQLAHALLPNLRFSDRERYYPVRAESWLTHTTSAPWPPAPKEELIDDVAALPFDPHRRGTAVLSANDAVTDLLRGGGPPNLADEPLRLTAEDVPESIGWSGYRDATRDWFLTFAGWQDDNHRHLGGDLNYLYDSFSELSSALDHRLAWRPLSGRPNRPSIAHQQPASPATYCEMDWAGIHPRVSLEGPRDFGPRPIYVLDGYLQVTYYFLFPAREPLANPPQPSLKPMEGQWAAVSMFLRARPSEQRDGNGRPLFMDVIDTTPEWVVFSHDYRDGHPLAQAFVVSAPPVETVADPATGRFCISVYVGAGSHRLFPANNAETPLGQADPWPSLDYLPGADYDFLLTGVFIALLPAELIGSVIGWIFDNGLAADLATGLAAIVGAILLISSAAWPVLVALLAFAFLWAVIVLLARAWDDDNPGDIPPAGDQPSLPGASAGDPSQGTPIPAGGDQHPPGGGPGGPPNGPGGGYAGEPTGWWPTNEGSPLGADVAFFDVMVISRMQTLAASDPTLSPPVWWDYPGRWGIKIPNQVNATWESGMPRVDINGRSWAYWNALALVNHLMQTAPSPAGP